MRTVRLALCLLAVAAAAAPAQDQAKAPDRSKAWNAMDYGPCLSTTAQGWDGNNIALKGRVIFLGDDAGVLFDTELLRVAAAWKNGYLNLRGTPFDGAHGPIPHVMGERVSMTAQRPGVAVEGGSFADTRPIPHGPMPRETGRFLGHYFHGDRVILSYEVGGRRVLESYDPMVKDGQTIGVQRTLEVAAGAPIQLALMDVPGDGEPQPLGDEQVGVVMPWSVPDGDAERQLLSAVMARVDGEVQGVRVAVRDERVLLSVPGSEQTVRMEVGFATMPVGAEDGAMDLQFDAGFLALGDMLSGGERRYPETLKTTGKLGTGNGAFVVDTVTVPADNPWKSRLRFGAFDFVDADTAALSTWNGDVWLVDGVDEDLDELVWTRFATGLHDPLGLKVVDGVIYTHGRDGLYRLHDLNDDGECDFVEVFNNDVYITKGFHEFAFDLQTDAEGSFYFSKGGPVNPGGRGFQKIVPHHGTIMKVSKDGSQLDVVMTGLRAPNGMGVGPGGVLSTGDNQGTWMPACRLNLSTNGTFGGCVDTAHMAAAPTTYDPPICWFPMSVDNSGGGQTWVPEGTWGPLGGELLHHSYGQCNVYLVLRQQDWRGMTQGGVVRIPADFASSQMRGRFGGDGNLYTVGFKGWQTRAQRETAFQRVRRSEAPLRLPTAMQVYSEGIELRFDVVLDGEVAADPESYEVEVWNYRWAERYGSPEYRPSAPEERVKDGQRNRDALQVLSAELGDDGKTVFLQVAGMQTCMQMRVGYSLDDSDGELVEGEIHNTIHFLPTRKR